MAAVIGRCVFYSTMEKKNDRNVSTSDTIRNTNFSSPYHVNAPGVGLTLKQIIVSAE